MSFTKSHIPWNKGTKGIMKINEGSFKSGKESRVWKGGRSKCTDCKKTLTHYDRNRCRKCYGLSKRGAKNPRWKGGKTKCVTCSKQLSSYAKRCHRCWSDTRIGLTGEKSNGWKGGISKTPGYKNNIRRKSRLNTVGSHTGAEWDLLKKRCQYICLCCKLPEPEIKLTEDHIIPLTKGGSDFIENIQPLCQSCNSRKHTKVFKY